MQKQYSSSPSLSSPPSAIISEPGSPTRVINAGRANIEMDEIIVDPGSASRFGIMQQQQLTEPPSDVPLTAAGLPRKKPGRKPGSTVKPKAPPVEGSPTNTDQPKQRRPRKPRDPNAPTVQRKRKAAATEGSDATSEMDARSVSGPPRQPKITELSSMRMALDARPAPPETGYTQAAPKREGSMHMHNLLNEEPPPKPQPAAPARQMFDPIRGGYDPIRESAATRDPYGTGPLGSPRAPTQVVNRASASPSIASLVDPPPAPNVISPIPSQTYSNSAPQPRFQESASMPPSPSNAVRSAPAPQHMPKPVLADARRPPPPPPAPSAASKPESKTNSFTSMTSIPSAASAPATPAAPAAAQSKKIAAVVQQEREPNKKARSSTSSSPKINSLKDALPPLPGGEGRSILDFGKVRPGEEIETPSISLHIPLKTGENNKYVNFMRMAEERYGWDALHPRLAASRERKARIAAATAALEKNGSGRESGDEMEEDLQSDPEGSNVEMGGMGNGNGVTGGGMSGPEAPAAPAKPARKKRNFKEDEYDKDDDFVDDSELLWEEQAAASRDGFFVYSGPLIPEVEKPAVPEGPPRRGRGGRGRGSRGGATRGEGSGRGRGGGPGSRGGTVRKPRITKLEKEQRDKEKAEREKLAQMSSKTGVGAAAATGGGTSLLGLPGQGAVSEITM
ncbi:Histone promoter control protein 2 [Madurella mycetomatis]|uniref:Histone promoter control protein 2 n=1 Tax=Madurella mycetomatis TaxID=100816 RepID=A0A175WB68_9PEZI|nr:Histone promoter control protein 2 [Madurella mycetomatis]